MQNSWFVVLPPLIALSLSFITHRILLSLFLGIISATFIFHDFSIIPAFKTAGIRLFEKMEIKNLFSWNAFLQSESLFIYLFLIFLGIIITIISTTGATKAYGNYIQKKLKSRISAETSTLLLSLLFFIDDYLNVLMVGSVMSPITDRFKVPRIKLAYFANAFAAALCIIVPFSTWGAFILRQLENSGVTIDQVPEAIVKTTPFILFIHTIPFAFYSFIIIIATFFIVRKNISFGLMHKHETIAQTTGNLYGKKETTLHKTSSSPTTSCSIVDFLFPIILLVCTVFLGLFLTNFSAEPGLFIGGSITLFGTIFYFLIRKKLFFSQLRSIVKNGFMLMASSLAVITLAWTFGNILTRDLLTGQFLASKLMGSLQLTTAGNFTPLTFAPLLFFIIATLTTLAIGSAWGSLGILIPISLPMVISMYQTTAPLTLAAAPIVVPTLSAVLAGAVTGNIFSPIADIVVMASTSTRAHHMAHITSQQTYLIPTVIATCTAFMLSGLLITYSTYINVGLSLGTGIILACLMYSLLNKRTN